MDDELDTSIDSSAFDDSSSDFADTSDYNDSMEVESIMDDVPVEPIDDFSDTAMDTDFSEDFTTDENVSDLMDDGVQYEPSENLEADSAEIIDVDEAANEPEEIASVYESDIDAIMNNEADGSSELAFDGDDSIIDTGADINEDMPSTEVGEDIQPNIDELMDENTDEQVENIELENDNEISESTINDADDLTLDTDDTDDEIAADIVDIMDEAALENLDENSHENEESINIEELMENEAENIDVDHIESSEVDINSIDENSEAVDIQNATLEDGDNLNNEASDVRTESEEMNETEESSYSRLYEYMTSHNYGHQHAATYQADSEWQELNNAFRIDQGMEPVDYGKPESSEYIDDIREQLSEVYGVPSDSAEMTAIIQNEQNGWDELHNENSVEAALDDTTPGTSTEMPPADYEKPESSEYIDDMREQLSEVYGVPSDSPEMTAILQNEQSGWDELHNENSVEAILDDTMPDISTEIPPVESNNEEMSEEFSGAVTIENDSVQIADNHLDAEENIETSEVDFENTDIMNDGGFANSIEDTQSDAINISDINTEINYNEVYEGLQNYDFDGIDYQQNIERLDASLDNFQQTNWENLNIDEQKDAMNGLAEYVERVIDFDNPPEIVYYNNPVEGDYGGYSSGTNTLEVNEYMLYNNEEAADTIAHELWHAYQHQCALNPKGAKDYQYQYGFENYVRPEDDFSAYQEQLVESEARAFAQQFKDRLNNMRRKNS